MDEQHALIEAVNDLARVFIACNEKIATKSEAVCRLNMVAMKPSRIASLLSMPAKDVTSQISKMKKSDRAGANNTAKGKRRG